MYNSKNKCVLPILNSLICVKQAKQNMKQANQELVIILPEGMENVSIRIIRKEEVEEVNIRIINLPEVKKSSSIAEKNRTLIWHQNEYEHIPLDEIMWIEANSSYCHIHATSGRKFTFAFSLARIEERLPRNQFIRIQRSYLVNIEHVKKLIGHSIVIDNHILKIGESYKDRVLNEFIFLGIREQHPLKDNKYKKD